ncbi:MAG TPA: hypothetical protein VFO73_10090 [Candidatus Limnocylindrales bacterium]|nr:hypothetical protein [Candidatus Limnocylindrales bacterium]
MDQMNAIDIPSATTEPRVDAPRPTPDIDAGKATRAFLEELARAMQAAAHRERERIAKAVADMGAEQVDVTRARAATEADELRRLADADVERIQVWSATEIDRIRAEAERRTAERRSDLEAYLAQHDAIIATEVEGVDAAVRDYDATLTRFVDELGEMTDPADIARRAGSLPPVPDLDAVRAAARAAAVARLTRPADDDPDDGNPDAASGGSSEANGVAVMDPDSVAQPDTTSGATSLDGGDADPTGPTPPAADPLQLEGESEMASDRTEAPNAAIRVLRSIAPWNVSPGRDSADPSSRSQ